MGNLHLPPIPQSQMYIDDVMSLEWQSFFRDLLTRVGGIDHLNMDELALDITGDIAAAILVHNNDTTHIHGIDDTSDLLTSEYHSKLIAPDGSPDPSLHIDNDGKTLLLYGVGVNKFSSDGTLIGDSDNTVPTEKATKTYIDLIKTDFIDGPLSPQILSGGIVSKGTNAESFKVSELTALIRTSDSDTAPLKFISLEEQDNIVITAADTIYYVILSYEDEITTISISTTAPNYTTHITIGKVMKGILDNWTKITDPIVLPTGVAYGVAFNHDGSLVAIAHTTSPYVTTYNTDDWSKVDDPPDLSPGGGLGVAFNHDDSLMAIAHSVSPYITIYNTPDWSKVTDPSDLPTGAAYGVAFNNDSSLMAVAHTTSPYITIYNTSDWSKVTDPVVLPAHEAHGVAFNNDDSLMAVAHNVSPYVTVYNTSDWSKVADPAILPTNTAYGVTFSNDDSLMVVAHSNSPFITVYNTSDWSKVANPTILPASTGRSVAFNNDDSSLAVAHVNSPFITVYNTSDWSKIVNPPTLPASTGLGVAFNHDGSLVVVAHNVSPYTTIYTMSNVHYIRSGRHLADGVAKLHRRAQDLREIELCCGSLISYSGTNNFVMATGISYAGINKCDLASYNSAVTTFVPIYQDGGGGWTEDTSRNTIDFAHYDDGSGTLGNVGNNKYGCHWVYKHVCDNHVYIVYGRDSYTLSEAETAPEPTKPDHLVGFGCLIGCIIAPQVGGSFTAVQMATDTFFVGTNTSNHNNLGGLQGGTLAEYYHFTAAQHPLIVSLIDNSIVNTLHRHSELVASDGDPDPALSVDATGLVSLVNGTGINEFSIDGTLVGNSDDAVPTEQAVKTYVDALSAALSAEIDSDIATHTALANAHHAQAHTITSHSDVVDATGAQLEELTGGGDTILHDHDGISENTAARHTQGTDTTLGVMTADINMNNVQQIVNLQAPAAAGEAIRQTLNVTELNLDTLTGGGDTVLHDHDGISENTAARHAESHTVVSHSDTTATGAELETLTDNSIADALHRHSELVASDGAPDPALSVDASGKVGIGTASPNQMLEINSTVNPTLRIAENSTSSYFEIIHIGSGQTKLAHRAQTGSALIDINPQPIDGASTAYFRFFRETTTTGGVGFQIFKGDGTGSTNSLFRGNGDSYLNAIIGDVGIGTASPTEKLDINGDAIRIRTAQTPASAGAAGTQGMICWDTGFIYVCTATNTWKRVAIATW